MRRCISLSILVLLTISIWASAQPKERTFAFTYAFTVRNVTPGQELRVWFPKAHSDAYQTVRLISVSGDLPVRQTRETEYGNEMFYANTAKATRDQYHFEAKYEVTRRERLGFEEIKLKPVLESRARLDRFLQPDRMVPLNGKAAGIAVTLAQGKASELQRARTFYDYVFQTMRYDKSGTGWGRGDAEWACDSKRGNCTDFHSLFAAMARSQGIPTRFAIGFGLPADAHNGEISGYHCWADFYLDHQGWIPVDISEAWKHPENKDYFFGAHDVNRIQFTTGRDITLAPRQKGDSLNYFVYPYVELDGKEHPNVRNEFSFADQVASTVTQASRLERN